MRSTFFDRWQAMFCALLLPLAALVIHPRLEYGISDDWSYIRMAEVLARTGHYGYNGWETPMIGYTAYVGAFFIKLFGESFTTVRMTDLLLATITGFLMQRTFVRFGLSAWSATLGTLAFLFSPVYLPYAFTFMSDIPGIFAMIVCLYSGTRALQAKTEARAIAWLGLTAAVGVVGGTGRQTAWLGVLVVVPSVTFLLRRNRKILLAGTAFTVTGAAAVVALFSWFNHQLYSQSEAVIRNVSLSKDLSNFLYVVAHTIPVFLFLLLPILLLFCPWALRSSNRSRAIVFAGTFAFLAMGLFEYHRHSLENWTNLYPGVQGVLSGLTFLGTQPPKLGLVPTIILWAVMLIAAFAFCAFCLSLKGRPALPSQPAALSWPQLAVLLGPFAAGYMALLLPRAVYEEVFNRYLLPLVMVAVPLLLRLYQERISQRVPRLAFACVALIGFYSVAQTHDFFASTRAKAQAVNELLAAGIPARQIDGGGEFDGLTQLDYDGYIHDPRTRLPNGARMVIAPPDPRFCAPFLQFLFPAVKPRVALSFDENACGGNTAFPPVTYHQWLAPHSQRIYIVKELN